MRSGRLPFDYRTRANPESTRAVAGDRSALIEHKEEQRLLRRLGDLRARGLGARRIARELNTKHSNPRTGRPWTPRDVWPETQEQRCWVHRITNVLDKLP